MMKKMFTYLTVLGMMLSMMQPLTQSVLAAELPEAMMQEMLDNGFTRVTADTNPGAGCPDLTELEGTFTNGSIYVFFDNCEQYHAKFSALYGSNRLEGDAYVESITTDGEQTYFINLYDEEGELLSYILFDGTLPINELVLTSDNDEHFLRVGVLSENMYPDCVGTYREKDGEGRTLVIRENHTYTLTSPDGTVIEGAALVQVEEYTDGSKVPWCNLFTQDSELLTGFALPAETPILDLYSGQDGKTHFARDLNAPSDYEPGKYYDVTASMNMLCDDDVTALAGNWTDGEHTLNIYSCIKNSGSFKIKAGETEQTGKVKLQFAVKPDKTSTVYYVFYIGDTPMFAALPCYGSGALSELEIVGEEAQHISRGTAETGKCWSIGTISTAAPDLVKLLSDTSDKAESLATVPGGASVEIYEHTSAGWYKIGYNDKIGYVREENLVIDHDIATGIPFFFGITDQQNMISLMESPDAASKVLTEIPAGTPLDVFNANAEGWYLVDYENTTGFIKTDQITFVSGKEPGKNEYVDATEEMAEYEKISVLEGDWTDFERDLQIYECNALSGRFLLTSADGDGVSGTVKLQYSVNDGLAYVFYSGDEMLFAMHPCYGSGPVSEIVNADDDSKSFVRGSVQLGSCRCIGYAKETADLMQGAADDSDVFGRVPEGSVVEIYEQITEEWYKVGYGNTIGYMMEEDLYIDHSLASGIPYFTGVTDRTKLTELTDGEGNTVTWIPAGTLLDPFDAGTEGKYLVCFAGQTGVVRAEDITPATAEEKAALKAVTGNWVSVNLNNTALPAMFSVSDNGFAGLSGVDGSFSCASFSLQPGSSSTEEEPYYEGKIVLAETVGEKTTFTENDIAVNSEGLVIADATGNMQAFVPYDYQTQLDKIVGLWEQPESLDGTSGSLVIDQNYGFEYNNQSGNACVTAYVNPDNTCSYWYEFYTTNGKLLFSIAVDEKEEINEMYSGQAGDKHFERVVPTANKGLFGDANGDGTVNIADAKKALDEHVIVNQIFGDPIITDETARYNADVTGDGKITEADAVAILKYITMESSMLTPSWYELTKNPNAPDAPAQGGVG